VPITAVVRAGAAGHLQVPGLIADTGFDVVVLQEIAVLERMQIATIEATPALVEPLLESNRRGIQGLIGHDAARLSVPGEAPTRSQDRAESRRTRW